MQRGQSPDAFVVATASSCRSGLLAGYQRKRQPGSRTSQRQPDASASALSSSSSLSSLSSSSSSTSLSSSDCPSSKKFRAAGAGSDELEVSASAPLLASSPHALLSDLGNLKIESELLAQDSSSSSSELHWSSDDQTSDFDIDQPESSILSSSPLSSSSSSSSSSSPLPSSLPSTSTLTSIYSPRQDCCLDDDGAWDHSPTSLAGLPSELLLLLLRSLPAAGVAGMSRVCRRLGELADDHSLAFHLASNNLHCVYAAAERVEAQLQLLTRQPDGLAASDRQRFDFLVDTLGHLRSVTQPLAEQLEREVAAVAGDAAADCRATHKSEAALALGRLLKTLHRLLLELVTFLRVDLETLRQQRRSDAELLHDHFDSFDLAIRRHACQITALFPAPDFLRRPSSIIQDERARDIWNSNFGAGCYAVPFRRFYTEVIRRLVKPEYLDRKDFINSLTYFINFPNDDMITPYKWHLLTRLFGPVADLSANFANIVMQPGFVGLVNRIRAEELLRDYCCQMNAPVYLLRFSRTATEYLVVSTILPSHGGSQLCHRLINMANWKNATLVDAVRQSTRGYKRLPMAVDGQAIVKLESLSSLARSASAYGYVTYSLCDID